MISNRFRIGLMALYLAVIATMIVLLFGGYEWSIPWEVTTYADPQEFGYRSFLKGPFQFGITGEYFSLAESFHAGPVLRNPVADLILILVVWFGFCVVLTVFTYLSRIWFFVTQGLVIFFLISLHLREAGVYAFGPAWVSSVLVILLFIVPAYFFQGFGVVRKFEYRLLVFLGVSGMLVITGGGTVSALVDQVTTQGYFGFVILALFFLVLISEEIVFGILYLVTKTRGGQNNHLHFISISLVYLIFIGLYYARKAGFINWEFTFFDPMILLIMSSVLALWSVKWRRETYDFYLEEDHFRVFLSGLGIVTFGFLSLAYFRGNDAVLDGTSKFITYAHLGFGAFFFFYVIVNFIDPLMQGLQVYKIAFKDQSFPYATARIGGFVAIAAFFLFADKQPYLYYRAGQYNYLGQQAEREGEVGLAQRLYQEGNIYGHDNHFSNYQLAVHSMSQGSTKEASLRFGRAILRNPSPQSFVNLAAAYAVAGEVSASQAVLEAGLERFPENAQITNNLSLIYLDLGQSERAEALLKNDPRALSWSDASLVNKWKVVSDQQDSVFVKEDFLKGNLAVKANIVGAAMRLGLQTEFQVDTAALKGYPLHRQAYLVNRVWYEPDQDVLKSLKEELDGNMDYAIRKAAANAYIQGSVYGGYVNEAIYQLRQDLYNAAPTDRARIYTDLGLIALENHSLKMAGEYFSKAMEEGEPSARMNLMAVFLESGQFDLALQKMLEYSKDDSTFLEMKTDFEQVLSDASVSESQLSIRLYYRYSLYSMAELVVLLQQQSPALISSLWSKIESELIQSQSFDKLSAYASVFRDYLTPIEQNQVRMVLDVHVNNRFPSTGEFAALSSKPDSLKAIDLFDLASHNALDEGRVLAISNLLKELNAQLNYDLLVQAIDINQTSVALHKAYCLQAVAIGFDDYGRTALAKLKELATPQDYLEFEHVFREHLDAGDRFSEAW